MIEFACLSSVFDGITFGVLLVGFAAPAEAFRSGWFVQSLLSELVIAVVMRTRRVFYRSRPGRELVVSTIALSALALVLPYLPGMGVLGLTPLPPALPLALVAITALCVLAAELFERSFYRRERLEPAAGAPLELAAAAGRW